MPPKITRNSANSTPKAAESTEAARRIDQLIVDVGGWRGERLAEIRQIIHEVDPGVIEEWKWKGTPVWSHEGMYVNANAFKDKVKITFHHGAQLSDPGHLFNAGLEGNKWRAIDIHEGERIDRKRLKVLLRAAVTYNTTHKVPKSKGSTAIRGSGKVVLLAGGNPQIPKGDGDAPVQSYIAAMPGWKHDVGRWLDALIVRTVPTVRKAVRWNSPFYGVGDASQGWFLSYHCYTKYIKVTFFRGTALTPPPPGTSKTKGVRYLDIHEGETDHEEQLASWIGQAAALPGWVL